MKKTKAPKSQPEEAESAFQVFISHSSIDTWVARQISRHLADCGARTFLDEADIEYGDDFEEKILAAAQASEELLVLFTPWAIKRPYIWLEIGAVWGQGKRVVGILYGLTASDLVAQDGTPALIKRIDLVEINKLDGYFDQLKGRVERGR
ncbi:MAG: toll/interleukin-1 receptor domain-containing protein [Blastocatellia bacterium]